MEGRGVDLLEQCLLIRRAEEKIVDVYSSDLIQSPVHLSIGQEAAAVGVCSALRETDRLFATYRSHAYYLAKGGSLHAFFAELMGREGGCCGGKGGSMHLAEPSVGFMGTSAIVASSLANAAGAAMANKLDETDNIVVAVIGDGAAEEGVYHEVMNLTSLYQLPLIIVVEDNGWAVHLDIESRQSFKMMKHAETYGIDTMSLGQALNPFVVAADFTEIVESVRHDQKPWWVHLDVFRVKEHVGPSEDFDTGYRARTHCDAWLAQEWSSSDWEGRELSESRVAATVSAAFLWAEKQPVPSSSSLLRDIL